MPRTMFHATSPSRSSARRALVAVALACVLAAPSCDDPACVFGGTCFGSGGGNEPLGANPASVPPDHSWLRLGAPGISAALPAKGPMASTSPLILIFDESMAQASLDDSLELVGMGGPGVGLPIQTPTLVGDGRMLVVLPVLPLQPGIGYELRVREDGVLYDLLGTTLPLPADRVLHRVTVADVDPATPAVVATWPPEASVDQSPTGEIAVVFDRPVQASSVHVGSFAVTVDSLTPAANPEPQALIFTTEGLAMADTRAWHWRSTDALGRAQPLAVGGQVKLALSQTGNKILAEDGASLAARTLGFRLAPFGAPLAAELVSLPMDAIGIANLDGSLPLELAVQIADGQAGDRLGIFLTGLSRSQNEGLISLYREVALGDVGYDPLAGSLTLGAGTLDLTESLQPLRARFADGQLDVALQLGREGLQSAVRRLDTDLGDAAPQGALLDTVRPTLTGLGRVGGALGSLRSDLRDLVVVGRADEELRAVRVTTSLGNNGFLPPVVAADPPASSLAAGLFVAAPVPLGNLGPQAAPLGFGLTLFDRALNRSAISSTAGFEQLGASGPAAALPGNATVSVEVFDAETLAPLVGARVFVHSLGLGAPVPLVDGMTDLQGRVTLNAAATEETVVTVDASGAVVYDLFTFQGVPTAWLSVPLRRSATTPALLEGELVSSKLGPSAWQSWAADSRLRDAPGNAIAVMGCVQDPLLATLACAFGPEALVNGPLGAAAYVSTAVPANEMAYGAASFLRGWQARLPRLASAGGVADELELTFVQALAAPAAPVEGQPIDVPALDLDASALAGVDLAALDPPSPLVSVECRLAGLGGALLGGWGVAFPTSGSPTDLWRLRAAYAGAVDADDLTYPGDELGSLVAEGVVTDEPRLRAELRDAAGNRSVRRLRVSQIAGSPLLAPVSTPAVSAPVAMGNTGGASFEIVAADVLPAGLGLPGLYRATLEASDGRRWTIWRLDGADPTVSLWVPPIEAQGGTRLVDGTLLLSVGVLAWSSFDPGDFLWSDLARDYEAYAEGAALSVQQP